MSEMIKPVRRFSPHLGKRRELIDCPHCGVDFEQIYITNLYYGFAIVCLPCGAQTGMYPTEDEAVAAWNQRAVPSPEALHGYWQVEPAEARWETTVYCQGCREKDADLAALRAENKRLRELEQACRDFFSLDEEGNAYPPSYAFGPTQTERAAQVAIGRLLKEGKEGE